jgi:hypothetical protein
MLADRWTQRAG